MSSGDGLRTRLTSRKFLALVGTALSALAIILQGGASTNEVGTFALAVVAAVSYIFAEAHVDAARANASGAVEAARTLAAAPAPPERAP